MSNTKIKIGISSKRHGPIRNKKVFEENLKNFLDEYSIDRNSLIMMNQVHGNTVSVVDSRTPFVDADGIITKKKNTYLGVVSADCVPLLLFDPEHDVVAAIHAGYRGVLSEIVENALEVLQKNGTYPSHMQAIIGPAIGVCCYDVDSKRAEQFRSQFGSVIEERDSKTFLNLPLSVEQILLSKGVAREHIFQSDICTSCHNDKYFSYRKDLPETYGTFMSIIGME